MDRAAAGRAAVRCSLPVPALNSPPPISVPPQQVILARDVTVTFAGRSRSGETGRQRLWSPPQRALCSRLCAWYIVHLLQQTELSASEAVWMCFYVSVVPYSSDVTGLGLIMALLFVCVYVHTCSHAVRTCSDTMYLL